MKIKSKLQTGTVFSVCIVMLLGFVLFQTSNQVHIAMGNHQEVSSIVQGVFELGIVMTEFSKYHEKYSLRQLRLRHESLTELLDRLHFTDEKGQLLLERLQEYNKQLQFLIGEYKSNYRKFDIAQGNEDERFILQALGKRLSGQISTTLQYMFTNATNLNIGHQRKVANLQQRTTFVSIFFATVLAVIILTVSIWVVRTILYPIARLQAGASIIGKGNLGYQLDIKTQDEVGELAEAFNEMSSGLRTSREGLEKEIKERKQAEEALRESEEKYRAIFEQAGDSIVLADAETGALVEFNEMAYKALGYTSDEFKGLKISDIDIDRSPEELLENIKRRVRDGVFKFDSRHRTKDGKIRNVQITGKSINIQGKNFNIAIWNDITERKQAVEALRESEERFREFVEGTDDYVVQVDADGKILYANHVSEKILGLKPQECIGLSAFDFIHPDDREETGKAFKGWVSEKKKSVTYENRQMSREGRSHQMLWTVNLHYDEEGRVKRVNSIARDITDLRRAEAQIKASLKEKKVLLGEVYHRVKNNMQLVASLLNLQAESVKEKQYVDMFKESRDRVRSMAHIHEKLYQSEDLANVNFKGYVKTLSNTLFRTYAADPNKIRLSVEVEDVSLGLKTAIPCGLLINELLTNSLKHAFPEGREGEIRISIRPIGEDTVELIFSDNGVGIPEDLDIKKTDSFGMFLINILAEDQLRGKIELDRTDGTKFVIQLKRQE